MSFLFCGVILLAFLLTTPDTRHWFVIPVYVCGVLVGADTVRLLRGKVTVFEPIGFISVIAFHFFFLAPLFHVRWDYWLMYIDSSNVDWRYWTGRMAFVNLGGLAAFLLVRNLVLSLGRRDQQRSMWVLNEQKFFPITFAALALAGFLQVLVWAQYGGIWGYINEYETSEKAFSGMGAVFMFSEAFPILAMMCFVVWVGRRQETPTWAILLVALTAFLAIQFLFGGLRGSRSNTIWALLWAVGLIHFWIRIVPRKLLMAGAVFVLVFMYAYGFYKSLGTDAFEILAESGDVAAVEAESGRSIESLLLLDLARTDVQAFLLYRLSPSTPHVEYQYRFGRTYAGALSLLIPRQLWPDRPPTKVAAGTDALYGQGTYESGRLESSRAYGLGGEVTLNFGVFAIPVAYALFGAVVGFAHRWQSRLRSRDSRRLLVTFITIASFYVLAWDADNIVFFLIKNGFLPAMVVFLSSRRVPLSGNRGLAPPAGVSNLANWGRPGK